MKSIYSEAEEEKTFTSTNADRMIQQFMLNKANKTEALGIYDLLHKDVASIDKKIYELEKLLRMFEESKYIGSNIATTIEGTIGLRSICLTDTSNNDYPATLKGSGYAIRAISFTLTALKSLPKPASPTEVATEENKTKAKSLVTNLYNYHKELGKYNADFFPTKPAATQEDASIKAQQGLYDLLECQAKALNADAKADPWYKRINFSKLKLEPKEKSMQKKRAKALRSSDDCQLLTRPIVTATKEIGNITIKQTFTPVTRITESQKDAWRKVADIDLNADIKQKDLIWFQNFPSQFRQEYKTMAQDAVELERLFKEKTFNEEGLQVFNEGGLQEFKKLVQASGTISERMKLRIHEDLTSLAAFENFNPFFILAQTASSGNRCSPQASNFVEVHTIVKDIQGNIIEDKSFTRSNENMLFDPRYTKDSSLAPEKSDTNSPFWQTGFFSLPVAGLFQKTLPEPEAKSLVKDTVITLEQIYSKYIAKDTDEAQALTQELDQEYAKHWGVDLRVKDGGDLTGKAQYNQEFKHKPILFSASLLSTLPGFIENGFLTRNLAPDRNRMMFYQKLLAFESLLDSKKHICGEMISMNFGANDYRKQTLMGFSNSMDRHNKHEAARLTLAALNNLVVASSYTFEDSLTNKVISIYEKAQKAVTVGKFKNLDRISTELLGELEQTSNAMKAFKEKDILFHPAVNNMNLALSATTEFVRLFKQREIPKSANEHIMLACYANIMVQSSSGSASQTDQHCKSGRDRTYTAQLHEEAMKVYFMQYGKLPIPDDSKEDRKNFINIFSDLFFIGLAQENSNQNQHGSFGLQNLTTIQKWPMCLVFGTINPKETCMLPYDIQEKLKERDPGLINNKNLRDLGKMSKKMKIKKKQGVKVKIKAGITSILLLALSPVFLCCKVTGKLAPSYNPLFTGLILLGIITTASILYVAPIIITAAATVQIAAAITASLLFIISNEGLDPGKKTNNKIADIVAITMVTLVIAIIMLNPVITALALPMLTLPAIICIAAVAATLITNSVKAVIPKAFISAENPSNRTKVVPEGYKHKPAPTAESYPGPARPALSPTSQADRLGAAASPTSSPTSSSKSPGH